MNDGSTHYLSYTNDHPIEDMRTHVPGREWCVPSHPMSREPLVTDVHRLNDWCMVIL